HDEPHVEVARFAALRIGSPSTAKPQTLAGLATRGHLQFHVPAEGGHRDRGASYRLANGDRNVHDEILALTLDARMRSNVDDEVQIAGLAAVVAGAALSRHPDA